MPSSGNFICNVTKALKDMCTAQAEYLFDGRDIEKNRAVTTRTETSTQKKKSKGI